MSLLAHVLRAFRAPSPAPTQETPLIRGYAELQLEVRGGDDWALVESLDLPRLDHGLVSHIRTRPVTTAGVYRVKVCIEVRGRKTPVTYLADLEPWDVRQVTGDQKRIRVQAGEYLDVAVRMTYGGEE